MPGWGRSFIVAIKTVLVGIAFAILGIIVMGVGAIPIILNILEEGTITTSVYWGIPLTIIGYVISLLGFYAALIKFTVGEALEEMKSLTRTLKGSVQESGRSCPNCRTPLVWVEEYKRWYCPKCKQYIP